MQGPELGEVVERLVRANEGLLEAMGAGDQDRITRLLAEIAVLERRRNRLVHQVAPEPAYDVTPPLRDQVIRAAHLLGRPASIKLIADVSAARFGERLQTTRISSLRRDEERSWSSSGLRRSVYVVPALAADRLQPVRATLALSTWPLELRIVGPASPRVDLLQATVRLADELEQGADQRWAPAVQRLVWRLASSIPGATGDGDLDPATVRRAAGVELGSVEAADAIERREAAERARSQLDEEDLLFGSAGLRAFRSKREAM